MLKSHRLLPIQFSATLRPVCSTQVVQASATDQPCRFAGAVYGGVPV